MLAREYMEKSVIPAVREAGYQSLAERLSTCGMFVNTIRCLRCESRHFAGFLRCGSRICLPCARVRGLLMFARVMQRIKDLDVEGNVYLYFLTLTLRNMANLKEMIGIIYGFWRALTHERKELRMLWKQRFIGYVRSMEIKRGKNSRLWHVHFHVLLVAREYGRDFEWICKAWKDITGDNGSVWIEGVDKTEKAVLEVCKYLVKPGNMDAEDWRHILESITGVRQVSTGGVFRGLASQVEEDMKTVEEEKLAQFVCAICGYDEGKLESIEKELTKDLVLFDVPKVKRVDS